MILFAILVIFLLMLLGSYLLDRKGGDFEDAMIGWSIASGIWIIIMVIVNGVSAATQNYSIEDLKAVDEKVILYQEKLDRVGSQFEMILGEQYPEHELEIFEGMTPDDVQLLFTKFPELKASLTAMSLVAELSDLYDDFYFYKRERINIIRRMNFRVNNPWILSWVIANPPDGIDNVPQME